MAWPDELGSGAGPAACDGDHRWFRSAEGSCADGCFAIAVDGGIGLRGVCFLGALFALVVTVGGRLRVSTSMRLDLPALRRSRSSSDCARGNAARNRIPDPRRTG